MHKQETVTQWGFLDQEEAFAEAASWWELYLGNEQGAVGSCGAGRGEGVAPARVPWPRCSM